MALHLGALRDALLDAGADVVKASTAHEEVVASEDRLAHVGVDLRVLKGMVGANLTVSLGILGRLLFIH
ncbi:MAG TPA: hypothetical protein VE690_18320 [Rhodopila sp.]|nr:hypothetical protein [Rhodopila sp.]